MGNTKQDTKGKDQEKTEKTTEDSQQKKIKAKDVDLNQYITVKNGFHGILVYQSSRTGEIIKWDNFGDEQEMELRELKNAKSSSKAFYENNWFMFDDEWVIDFLGVRNFYKHAIKIDDLDSIFEKDADELKKVLDDLSNGQRQTVAYRARTLINEGKIDSLKTIAVLEKTLGVELIEK